MRADECAWRATGLKQLYSALCLLPVYDSDVTIQRNDTWVLAGFLVYDILVGMLMGLGLPENMGQGRGVWRP